MVESVYCAVRTDSLYKADYVTFIKVKMDVTVIVSGGGRFIAANLKAQGDGNVATLIC